MKLQHIFHHSFYHHRSFFPLVLKNAALGLICGAEVESVFVFHLNVTTLWNTKNTHLCLKLKPVKPQRKVNSYFFYIAPYPNDDYLMTLHRERLRHTFLLNHSFTETQCSPQTETMCLLPSSTVTSLLNKGWVNHTFRPLSRWHMLRRLQFWWPQGGSTRSRNTREGNWLGIRGGSFSRRRGGRGVREWKKKGWGENRENGQRVRHAVTCEEKCFHPESKSSVCLSPSSLHPDSQTDGWFSSQPADGCGSCCWCCWCCWSRLRRKPDRQRDATWTGPEPSLQVRNGCRPHIRLGSVPIWADLRLHIHIQCVEISLLIRITWTLKSHSWDVM